MKKTDLIYWLAAAALVLPACSNDDDNVIEQVDPIDEVETYIPYSGMDATPAEVEIIGQQNDFSYELFKKLFDKANGQQTNFLVSPLCTSMSLSMLANGAQGDTRDEILDVLGFEDGRLAEVNTFNKRLAKELASIDNTSKISLANSIWIDKSFPVYESFISDNQQAYGAEIYNEELSAENTRQAMNAWASDKTNGLIPEFLKSTLDSRTMIYLMNALYFKGKWSKVFDKSLTAQGDFHNVDGTVSHPMMMREPEYSYGGCYDTEGASWITMAIGNGAFELLVILPDEGVTLKDYFAGLTKEEFFDMFDNSIWKNYDGELVFPVFELGCEYNLADTMKELGMNKAFSLADADFSLISKEKTAISGMKQEAKIIFNEDGAEAAALEGDDWGSWPGKLPVLDLTLDRPFAFMIRVNQLNSILFAGCVNKL